MDMRVLVLFMRLADRIDAFKQKFPANSASWPWLTSEQGRDVLYGVWVIGNDYRNKTNFYGSYPPSFVDRVMALFPDAQPDTTLHVFSGSLPPGPYVRCDMMQEAELKCNVYDLPSQTSARFNVIMADPPYTASDAERYGTPMVDRRRAMAALAAVAQPHAHLAWLDTVWPMHSKSEWVTVGRILIQRSTNHRVRALTLFQRV